jgi:hypothetical protein
MSEDVDISRLKNKEDKFVITNPVTKKEYAFDPSILSGADWSRAFQSNDGDFTPDQIKKYYDAAMAMDWQDGWYSTPEMKKEGKSAGYKHITLGGSDTERVDYEIEQDWVKEIWDNINPGLKLIRHYLNGHGPNQSGGIHLDGWTGNQYTVIVYLTPDMTPEDGGTLELWTPNITDEQKALAINSPYSFGNPYEHYMDVQKSFWPKPGRVVVFDARIPHVARAVESDKFRVSLVFKGTTLGLQNVETSKPTMIKNVTDNITDIEFEEVKE